MPAMYKHIKEKMMEEGRGEQESKRIAAATYNKYAKKHHKTPMSPSNPEARPRKRK